MHKMYPLWDLGGKYLLISSNLLYFTKYQFWVLNIVYLFNRSFIKFFGRFGKEGLGPVHLELIIVVVLFSRANYALFSHCG